MNPINQINALLLHVLADAPAMLWAADAKGIVTLSQGQRSAGQGPQSAPMVDRSIFDHYRDHPESCAHIRQAIAGEAAHFELKTTGAINECWIEPVKDAKGRVVGIVGVSMDVTQGNRGAAVPRCGQERLHAAIDGFVPGIVTDQDGQFLFVNQACADLLGYTDPDGVCALSSLSAVIAPEAQEQLRERNRRRRHGDAVPATYEAECVRQDGSAISLLVIDRPVDWHGRRAIHSTLFDLGERDRVEGESRRRERQYRDLIDGSLQGILIRRGDRLVFVNQMWAQLHGFASPEAAIAFGTVKSFMTPDDADRMRAGDAQLLRDGQPIHEIVQRIRVDGTTMLLEQTKRLVDWDGAPAIQVTVIDVTDRQRAEAEMRASQKLLQSVVDALPLHVFAKDLNSSYVMVNRALAEFYGISKEDFRRTTVLDLPLTQEERKRMREDDLRVMRTREPYVEPEKRISTRNGRVLLCHSTKIPLVDEHGAVTGLLGVGIDITERKRAEAALRQSDQIYQQIRDAVIATDLAGRVILWSGGAQRMYGYSEADMMGKTLGILWPESVNGEDAQQALYVELERTGHLQATVQRRRKSGEVFHASVSLAFLKDEHGNPYGIVGTSHDVSDMKRVEAALRQSEEQYRALVEGSLQGIIIYRNERIEFANAACASILDYGSAEDLRALPSVDAIVAPEDQERMRVQRLRRLSGVSAPDQYEALLVRRDGTPVHVLSSSRVIQWRGAPAIQTAMMDITERKIAEEALREKEWFLSRAQRAGRIGTWYRPLGSDRIQWSEETYRISGVDPQTFVPSLQSNLELIHPDDRALFLENRRRVADAGQTFMDEYRIVRPNGQLRYVQMVGERIADAAGNPAGVIGIVQDITERKQAEQEMLRAQKMEAVGRLTAGVAHDFNNLLTVIRGNLELCLEQLPAADPLRPQLDAVLNATDRGAGLIRQLSTFARQKVLHPTYVNPGSILTSVIGLTRRTLGSQIEIDVFAAPDLWPVRVDPAQFESAILNLVINARDAMPNGGQLRISASNETIRNDGDAAQETVPCGEYVAVVVSDTGTGISPDIRDKVFDPFFTTKDIGRGTGLGLSTIANFVRQSGGHVSLDSKVGQGTTVRIYLPRLRGTAEQAPSSTGAGSSQDASGGVVLIVEDRPELRTVAEQMFAALGWASVSAGDGPTALRLLEERDDIGLLFSDVMLPKGMNGAQLAEQALHRRPHLPVLMTSGFAEHALELPQLMKAGVQFVAKPYRLADIRARLAQLAPFRGNLGHARQRPPA